MSFLVQTVTFIALLGALVFVHELGHFLAAKFFNVKVLKFSLGFGPRVWGFRKGETEYQIAALPLGGFVKMAGENPAEEVSPEDRGRGFSEQAPYRRAVIAFAGPFVNLTLPVLVYFLMNLAPQMKEPAIVTVVLPNEPAERAGVLAGDRIVSVDGEPTRSYEEMREEIAKRPGRTIDLIVERNGERKTLPVTVASTTEKNIVETTTKGRIGVGLGRAPSYVGVVPGSRADQAGLKTFDRVVQVNGKEISARDQLMAALAQAGTGPVELKVIRSSAIDLKTSSVSTAEPVTVTIPAGESALGIEESDLYIREVPPESKAFAAGLRAGDKIVALNGTPILSGMRLETALQDIEDKTSIHLTVDRAGQKHSFTYDLAKYIEKDTLYGDVPRVEYGFRLMGYQLLPFRPEEMVRIQYGPVQAFSRAIDQTIQTTRTMVLGIAAMFSGKVSTKQIGGPIMMFQLAGVAAESGLSSFLRLFAFISINLGLMNLLPIPVLDGFHIIVASVEGISRRAIPVRVREVAQLVGVVMLLMLMALAFKNDIFRVLKL